jgi:hypothetical protein
VKGPSSTLGGAGFCKDSAPLALTRGVVITGSPNGTSSQNVFTVLDLTKAAPAQIQVGVGMNVTNNGQPYTFQPRMFFSPDCTIAMVVGANKLGPSKNVLVLRDLLNGQPLGHEVTFETNIFSAQVQDTPTGQRVVVTVDTGTPSQQTVNVSFP